MTGRFAEFLRSDLGKAAAGLLIAVLSVCFPQVPGYVFAALAFYYATHQFSRVVVVVYEDFRKDLWAQRGD